MTMTTPQIALYDQSYRPEPGDVLIEIQGTPQRPIPEGVYVIDPQHGGHRPAPGWPDTEAGDAACTYAARLAATGYRPIRVVLSPFAGLDDFAAAVLCGADLSYDGASARLRALADADNVRMDRLPEWAPGQELADVGACFPGLGRLCATRLLPMERRVNFVRMWIEAGICDVDGAWLTAEQLTALGLTGADVTTGTCDLLPALDRVARERRAAYCARCTVRQHGDLIAEVDSPAPSGDPSEGQGGLTLGYHSAPVVVAHYPLPDGRRKYTVARAANARRVALDYAALRAALNEAEAAAGGDPSWGGNPTTLILGSPRAGSVLPPEAVVSAVQTALHRAQVREILHRAAVEVFDCNRGEYPSREELLRLLDGDEAALAALVQAGLIVETPAGDFAPIGHDEIPSGAIRTWGPEDTARLTQAVAALCSTPSA